MKDILKQQLLVYVILSIILCLLLFVCGYYHVNGYLFTLNVLLELGCMVRLYKINSKLESEYQYYWGE